ncbi:MAG: FHA domain-containing protein [Kofleriaceae bacterium]
MLLRIEVSEAGQGALPPVDLEARGGAVISIGSAPDARIRLPAQVAQPRHLEIADGQWRALGDVVIDGARRAAGERGEIGDGVVFELGGYRIRVAPAPVGTTASTPQRTESLARELLRSLLGAGAAPSLEIAAGPAAGSSRGLPPPEAVVVIGRGDEADWVILDEDLSRVHCEVRRGWDGVSIRDLGSKNRTRVDGAVIAAPTELHDGARIELGHVALVFRDPAERHLRGASAAVPAQHAPVVPRAAPVEHAASRWPFVISVAIAGLAAGGLAWVLAS